jgi:flagellar protein FliO/FliZ
VSLGRLPARSGAAALLACAVTAVAAPAALGASSPYTRDETPLPKSLTNPSTAHAAAHAASTGGTIARTVAGLAIVLAVVFAVYWLLRAYSRGKRGRGDGKIEVIATTPLAPNRSVHLLRVGDALILVGSAEGGVTRLRSYSPEESDLIQAQLDGDTDQLWQLDRGGDKERTTRSFVDELRRRTAR